MKTITTTLAAVALLALGTIGTAEAGPFKAGANFGSVSASAIATQLPRSADNFSALVGQTNSLKLKMHNNTVTAETLSGTLAEFDGWRNNNGGVAAAAGFAAIQGWAKR